MNYDKIGDFIASKRKEHNLTQNELANKLGITGKAVSRWERGLGCPDISILEILAKELDVSVLELLKGRKIENEVIKVTEADDYIKDTFKESKHFFDEKLRKIISIIIVSISILIFIMMCWFNLKTYINITKKEEMDFSANYSERELGRKIDILKTYINRVENNKELFSYQEYEELHNFLVNMYDYYNNSFIFNINSPTYLSFNDIYIKSINESIKWNSYDKNLLQIYEKYLNKKASNSFIKAYTKKNDVYNSFVNSYNNIFQSQLAFKIEEDVFDTPLFHAYEMSDSNIALLDEYLIMIQELMESVGIYE